MPRARTGNRPTTAYVRALTRNILQAFQSVDLALDLNPLRPLPAQHRDHRMSTKIRDTESTRDRHDRVVTDSEGRLRGTPVVERDEPRAVELDCATQPCFVLHD